MASNPEVRTFPQFIRAIAQSYDKRPAVVREDQSITYQELDERSAAMAKGLLARGVAKGSRVAILFSNGPDWAVAMAAVTRIGAVVVPLSSFLKPPELARVLRHSDVQGIVMQPHFLGQDFVSIMAAAQPELAEADGPELVLARAPYLRWAVVTSGEVPAWARPLSWLTEHGDERFDDALLAATEAEVHPEDVAAMIYTSGQSADPKGVIHSQGGLIGKVNYLSSMLHLPDGVQHEAMMPYFWVGGFALDLMCTLAAGGTSVCANRATSMGKGGVIGAIMKEIPANPVTGLRSGLGMSETFAIYAWGPQPARPDRPLCVPMEVFETGYVVKVVGPDGAQRPDGEAGEILIRGPSVTKGIHKVERTAAFDADGFYRTGDEGVFENGTLYLLGRLSDMIKTSGANVAPAEVERELVAFDGVAAAHVVAVPDAERGQIVGAAIVPEDGAELDLRALRDTLRTRLSSYKVPRLAAVIGYDKIPTTQSRKIRKRELAALLREVGTRLDE